MIDPKEAREKSATWLEEVAIELEKAAAHAKVAAQYFRSEEIPRACAHSFATEGHLLAANDLLKQVALLHRLGART